MLVNIKKSAKPQACCILCGLIEHGGYVFSEHPIAETRELRELAHRRLGIGILILPCAANILIIRISRHFRLSL